MNGKLVAIGSALIAAAVLPTPDDVLIVSPIAQLIAGSGLLIAGLAMKK